MNNALYNSILKVAYLAKCSKLRRLLNAPIKYCFAVLHRIVIYRLFHKSFKQVAKCSWGDDLLVNLPAGTDIFLTGGKTDDSEIRLAKFMVKTLTHGDCFIDVGSHFGYYSLLAKECVKPSGKIISLEASPTTFDFLKKNTSKFDEILCLNVAGGKEKGSIIFYEFPTLYSEFNTVYPNQFANTKWFSEKQYKQQTVLQNSLDNLIEDYNLTPRMIKIDTEGYELEVIKGLTSFLKTNHSSYIIMEYLAASRGNKNHQEACALMISLGYDVYIINQEGSLDLCSNIDNMLQLKNLESDNIVFCRVG